MSRHKFITEVCDAYRLFWDATPVLWMCDPLCCIFHILLATIELMEWFAPGVWLVELWSPVGGR